MYCGYVSLIGFAQINLAISVNSANLKRLSKTISTFKSNETALKNALGECGEKAKRDTGQNGTCIEYAFGLF